MGFALQARQIRKSFGGVEVLHGVDLDIAAGTVLALLGENGAGKSTLVKIIAGDYHADRGAIVIDGASHAVLTPRQARQLGVAIVFQEFQDASTLTVAENISLGRIPNRWGVVSWSAIRDNARQILDQLEVDIDPDAIVGTLSVGERQIVEIARALSGSARLLILDEPTAALSQHEAAVLFDFVRRLKAQGVAIIYITHRMDEVTQVADKVQILRDGSTSLLENVADTNRRDMIEAVVGRRMDDVGRPARPTHAIGAEPVLRYTDATLGRFFSNVSLEVHPGEVVALFGKLGSGATEVAEVAFGLHHLDAGTLEVRGTASQLKDPASAISAGVGFLPADRKAGGAFMVRSVAENVAIASWPRMSRLGIITDRVEANAYQVWRDKINIRARDDPKQLMGTLSGGNQQKVLLARWLERDSAVLVLIEPTRGVDVGARADIYATLRDLAATGAAILIVTSDFEEAVQVADRTYVMGKGAIAAQFVGDEITSSGLMAAAGG